MDKLLEVVGLTKSYGKKQVIKNVSFTLSKGEILGLIGPNGAGKSTIIKSILGLLNIDSGSIKINGYDLKKDFKNAINHVGAIVENPDTYTYLSGMDNLKIVANLYNTSKEDLDNIIETIGLKNRINDKVKKYSLGMKERLSVGIALVSKPTLLILDEPTNGLDPEGIIDLRNLLVKLSKEGIGIMVSSHNIKELESFCTNICLIKNGKVISDSSLNKLKNSKDSAYIIKLNSTKNIEKIFEDATILDDNMIKLNINKDDIPDVISKLSKDYKIFEIRKEEVSLEEIFIDKTGGNSID